MCERARRRERERGIVSHAKRKGKKRRLRILIGPLGILGMRSMGESGFAPKLVSQLTSIRSANFAGFVLE